MAEKRLSFPRARPSLELIEGKTARYCRVSDSIFIVSITANHFSSNSVWYAFPRNFVSLEETGFKTCPPKQSWERERKEQVTKQLATNSLRGYRRFRSLRRARSSMLFASDHPKAWRRSWNSSRKTKTVRHALVGPAEHYSVSPEIFDPTTARTACPSSLSLRPSMHARRKLSMS